MKKKVILLILVIGLSILIFPKFKVNAYEATAVTFDGIDSALDINEKSNYIKINDDSINYNTSITFLVHGLKSDPSCWSNTLGNVYGINIKSSNKSDDFGYDPNSIIEVIRRRVNADVYLVNNCDSTLVNDPTTNKVTDVQVNSFKLRKLFVAGFLHYYLEQMVDVEIYHNEVETEKFVIKNKYLNKANIYNYSNYRAFDKDSDVLCSLNLECFNSIKDNERYKEIVEKAKNCL